MRPERFQQFALDALAKAPDVQGVESWDGRSTGFRVTFTTGAELCIGATFAAAPGEKYEQPEQPVHAEPPAEVPYPDLYEDGKVSPDRAKRYLAAALTNSGCDEIARAYPYADTNKHPGMGVVFHNGAKAFCLFEATARPGQGIGGRNAALQGAF
ncbi:hypothetical protein [Streptomyces sp. NPDC008240]|uniref:hypothetical protein n=1 Tax=Streptomyces sp. NPDC008240 TaxID=3364822 RepID=UPI0036E288BD